MLILWRAHAEPLYCFHEVPFVRKINTSPRIDLPQMSNIIWKGYCQQSLLFPISFDVDIAKYAFIYLMVTIEPCARRTVECQYIT